MFNNPRTCKPWSRRGLLQTLTIGSAGLAFAGAWKREIAGLNLLGSDVRAAAAAPPRRLLIVHLPHGIKEGGGWRDWLIPGKSETDFTLGDITAPLAKHRDQAVFFDNVCFARTSDWGDTHWTGVQAALTASTFVDASGKFTADAEIKGARPGGPSIDWFLGNKLGTVVTPSWPSVQMNLAAILEKDGLSWTSYNASGQCLPAFNSPWVMYQKMFANLPSGGATVAPDPAATLQLLKRRSVLDTVAKDIGDFQKRLPPEDRLRADAQLDAIRTLEQRLGADPMPAPTAACAKPTLPKSFDLYAPATYPQLLTSVADSIVAMFACDVTRFAMLGLRTSQIQPSCQFDPINMSSTDHELSHDHRDDFIRLKAYYMTQVVSYLLDRLSAIPEQDGTMLDNTVLLVTSEISMGHTHQRMPWMTLGGSKLGIRGGRYLKLPTVFDHTFPSGHRDYGYPHARILLSLVNAMGLPEKTFGIPEIGNEPVPTYVAA